MKTEALPPVTIHWLAASILLVQLPHFLHLPIWLIIVGPALVMLRLLLDLRQMRMSVLLLAFFAVGLAYLSRLHFGYLIGRDPGIAFMTGAIALKLLETRNRRDVMWLQCLNFFMLPTAFFYASSLPLALYVVAAAVVLVAALAATREAAATMAPRTALRLAASLIAQGLPIALALFVLFPRLHGPLWVLHAEAVSRSGLSDHMEPGSVANLSLSDDIAFRVAFEGAPPPPSALYWRGPVLTRFDGRSWSMRFDAGAGAVLPVDGPRIAYRVSLEPHDRNWLFALDMAAEFPAEARLTSEQQLLSAQQVLQAMEYRASSTLSDHFPASSRDELQLALALPGAGNPRARNLGRSLREDLGNPRAVVAALLKRFGEEEFHYTLDPPLYEGNGIDEFLFGERRGFCEHYAGAAAFVLRAAGIPARVVTGYQGGEVNQDGGYMLVRQADAHAWVEAWFENAWRRIDPTAAVSPLRIERGLGAAVPDNARVPLLARLDMTLLKSLRLHWDAVNYRWQHWVVEFNRERQLSMWRELGLPRPQPWQVALVILAVLALWSAFLLPWLLRSRARDPALRLWEKFCLRLARSGLPRAAHEAPLAYARRAARRWPEARASLLSVGAAYCAARYGKATPPVSLKALLEALRRVPRLARRRR